MLECYFCKRDCDQREVSSKLSLKFGVEDELCGNIKPVSKKKLVSAIFKACEDGIKEGARVVVEAVQGKQLAGKTIEHYFDKSNGVLRVMCRGESEHEQRSRVELEQEISRLKEDVKKLRVERDRVRVDGIRIGAFGVVGNLDPDILREGCSVSADIDEDGVLKVSCIDECENEMSGVDKVINLLKNPFAGKKCECGEGWPFKETHYLGDEIRFTCHCGRIFGVEELNRGEPTCPEGGESVVVERVN